MAINFPDSPSVNDTHTVGDRTWKWDGAVWNIVVGTTSDHGNLAGLSDDDHTQYLRTDGTRTAASLTVSGAVTVDTDTFVVDNVNDRVGIGTTSPNASLEVARSSNGLDDVHFNGQVRIDGADPSRLTLGATNSANLWSVDNANGTLRVFRENWSATGSGTSGAVRMAISDAGIVTMPQQPCFYAYITGSNPTRGAGWTVVPYNAELFDNNGDFNTSNSRFVAPVTGKYQFNTTVSAYNIDQSANATQLVIALMRNGSEITRLYQSGQYTSTNSDRNRSGSAVISMAANDYLEVRVYSADTSWQMSAGTVWNSFSGFLIG